MSVPGRCALVLLTACGSGAAHITSPGERPGQARACPSETPRGKPEDYALPQVPEGVSVAEPRMCKHGEAYIQITRTNGARRLGTARGPGGGFSEGCMTLPDDPQDGSCPVINAPAVMDAARQQVAALHFEAGGPGLGPCGDIQGDYAAWNMSVEVVQWSDAAVAVQRLSMLLARYDLQGTVGVAVVGIPCAELL